MKKLFILFVLAVTAVAACCEPAAGEAAEDTEFRWSDPGNYLTDVLAPRKEIHDEKEAEAYAEELWALLSSDPLPDGVREMNVDRQDGSYHFSISDENEAAIYCANFLSNGLIQQIGYYENDSEWASEGLRRDGKTLKAEAWESAESQIIEQVERLVPGALALVKPLNVFQIIDFGDRQYLIIYAEPLDPAIETGVNITAVLEADGTCRLLDYSCYGAG